MPSPVLYFFVTTKLEPKNKIAMPEGARNAMTIAFPTHPSYNLLSIGRLTHTDEAETRVGRRHLWSEKRGKNDGVPCRHSSKLHLHLPPSSNNFWAIGERRLPAYLCH